MPAEVRVGQADRLHPLIPRETARWSALYRRRASVEREFGRLKHESGLSMLRVRGIERGPAARRPDDPREARLRAQPGSGYASPGLETCRALATAPDWGVWS